MFCVGFFKLAVTHIIYQIMQSIFPIHSASLSTIDVHDQAIKATKFCILGKYVADTENDLKALDQSSDDYHHVHNFFVEDQQGKLAISYNFEISEFVVLPYVCGICKIDQESGSERYVRVTRATAIPLQGQEPCLRSESVEVLSETGEKLEQRIQHHLLSTQNQNQWAKMSLKPKRYDPAEAKMSTTATSNASKTNESKDPFEAQFSDYDQKYYPLLHVFKNHALEHEGVLSAQQIAEYLKEESEVTLDTDELHALLQEAIDWGLLNCDQSDDLYSPSFTV